jgi:hypothetical protein
MGIRMHSMNNFWKLSGGHTYSIIYGLDKGIIAHLLDGSQDFLQIIFGTICWALVIIIFLLSRLIVS